MKLRTIKIIAFFTLLLPYFLSAQPNFPELGEIYVDTVVPRVDIIIDPDTLDWIYDHPESKEEHLAQFIFNNGNIIDTIDNIGFRIRGNTSTGAAKKSFKVSFNTFESGRKWEGVEKLNLNGEHNDPSIIRSKLCWDLMRKMGVPASRSNHVEVYINNNYYGLYINVEHIDEVFVNSRFGNNDGNLFKCLWPADLDYLGPNPDMYKFTNDDRRAYDLKTNKDADDYSDLAHFIDVLNNTSDDNFKCEIENIFNVYDYLKVAAVDIVTGNWDNYIYLQNNYYLYHNLETGKFEFIPYDMDNTIGIDWIGRDWANRDIYDWQQHGNNVRPLYTLLMENDEFKNQFSYYINYVINEFTDATIFSPEIFTKKTMIGPFVDDDPYYPLDWGFTTQDFDDSYTQSLGGHVDYGLIPFLETRNESALDELELFNIVPIIKYIKHIQLLPGENLWVSAFVEDEDPNPEVKLNYNVNDEGWQSVYMYDDGDHNDGEDGDGIFGGTVFSIPETAVIEYTVSAKDNNWYTNELPCEPIVINVGPSDEPALFINEFMASNDSTIADEYGEFDDWIEVFNNDENAVWLGNKYLTDNLGNKDKWLMPDVTIQPGEFILFWADGQPGQGPNHTNFKLNKEGEEIGMFDSPGTGFFTIDSIIYEDQSVDTSFGRKPDGFSEWLFIDNPTPGYSNLENSIFDHKAFYYRLDVYPNPVIDGYVNLNKKESVTIYNSIGEVVLQSSYTKRINVSLLVNGVYILVSDSGGRAKFIIN